MENQHRKIQGYRELTAEEINLMNIIKEKGSELLALHAALVTRLNADNALKSAAALNSKFSPEDESSSECIELKRFTKAEPFRWAAIGKTDIQTGVMALIRAVAQPQDD